MCRHVATQRVVPHRKSQPRLRKEINPTSSSVILCRIARLLLLHFNFSGSCISWAARLRILGKGAHLE